MPTQANNAWSAGRTKRGWRRVVPLYVLHVCLVVCGHAFVIHADVPQDAISYRVRDGDSLPLLAAEYYGDRNHAVFLMVANKILHPRPLKVGELIKIPMSREVTTAPGDTFATLAQTYLGDARRAPFLADFNGVQATERLAAGATLSVPFHVTHTAASTESLASIGAANFADAGQGQMLARYNFLAADSIDAGTSIVIPIFHVRVRSSKLPPVGAEARARAERRRSSADGAKAALPLARASLRAGDFAGVKRALTGLDLDYLDGAVAAEVGLTLGTAYLAFDDADTAQALFRRAIERHADFRPLRYAVSPKVRQAWQRAGGQLAEAPISPNAATPSNRDATAPATSNVASPR